jgi:hypothetical protein
MKEALKKGIDQPTEYMEMPCKCDCGKWFDLEDGYKSINSDNVICVDCSKKEKQRASKTKKP